MTRKDDKGDQQSGGETTWTNTRGPRSGRGLHRTGYIGDGMLRPAPNHGTLRLPNDDDDDEIAHILKCFFIYIINMFYSHLHLIVRTYYTHI